MLCAVRRHSCGLDFHFYRTLPGVDGVCTMPPIVRGVPPFMWNAPRTMPAREIIRTECSPECVNRDASFTTPAAVFVHSVSICVRS